jgi:hypothetical protein
LDHKVYRVKLDPKVLKVLRESREYKEKSVHKVQQAKVLL